MTGTVLIVEDDSLLLEAVSDYYRRKGWKVWETQKAMDALRIAEEERFDLVLLDVMLPDGDGFFVCERLRKRLDVPIIFITARSLEEDKLKGYRFGADDYVVKPFFLPVLFAKTEALIGRIRGSRENHERKVGELTVNLKTRRAWAGEREVSLSPREFDLLAYFMKHRGEALSRERLLAAVWGYEFEGTARVVDNHIKKLRKNLSPFGTYI